MSYNLYNIVTLLPKHPTRIWKKRGKPTRIVVHCTASSNQNPYKTARYHITPGNHLSKKGAPGLAYHDFITDIGVVYHCNYYEDRCWHAGAYNKSSIGVTMAFKGHLGDSPTADQMDALEQHLTRLCLYYRILPKNIIGHREVPGMWSILGNGSRKYKKTCPGMAVNLERLRNELTKRMQRKLAAEGLYTGGIDGLFGKKSKKALNAYTSECLYE